MDKHTKTVPRDKHTETFYNYLLHLEYMDFISIAKLLKVRFLEEEATETIIKEAYKNDGNIDSLKDKLKFRRDFEAMIQEVCDAFSKQNREERRRLLSLLRKATVHTERVTAQIEKKHKGATQKLEQLESDLTKLKEEKIKLSEVGLDNAAAQEPNLKRVSSESELVNLAQFIQDGVDKGKLKTTLKDGHHHLTE